MLLYIRGLCNLFLAFCNAGFIFFDNDLPYAMVGDVLFNMNTMALIVIGGFGYLATFDIWSHRKLRRFVDLKLHTKIMLVGHNGAHPLGTIIFWGLSGRIPKRLALYLYGTRSWHLCFNRLHLVQRGLQL